MNVAEVPTTFAVLGEPSPVNAVTLSFESQATPAPEADADIYLVVGVTAVTTALPVPLEDTVPVATVVSLALAVATVTSDAVNCVVVCVSSVAAPIVSTSPLTDIFARRFALLFDAVHVPSAVVWDVPAVTFDAVVVPATPFREVVTILFELVTERLLTYCNLPVAVLRLAA